MHTIVLDAGPILCNDPPISILLAKCDELVTVPAVVSEIKDQNARSRLQSSWLPFLSLRSPSPGSVKVITDFARKTGDLTVLSGADVQVLALAYEVECEQNDGDWRLRSAPGQKGLNGPASKKSYGAIGEPQPRGGGSHTQQQSLSANTEEPASANIMVAKGSLRVVEDNEGPSLMASGDIDAHTSHKSSKPNVTSQRSEENSARAFDSPANGPPKVDLVETHIQPKIITSTSDSESSGSEGWITPLNVKKHQVRDGSFSTVTTSEDAVIQVATITADFAMQNVLLQMNLNLLSPNLQRVRNIKTYILRCHACFFLERRTSQQFCARCGKPTLTRVSCSTSQAGKFSIHLKKNMQWNHRGDRFSIPKPIPGSAHGKPGTGKGGGKGGWGQELILAEDQKEYLRAMSRQSRKTGLDLMDEDYLPGIMAGDRGRNEGRPKIGGGRNVNSKKR